MGKTKWFSSPRMVWNHVLFSDMGCKMCLRPSTFVFWHLYGLWFACIGAGKSSCVIIFEDNTKILDSCQCYWRSLSVNLLWLPPDKKTLDFFFLSVHWFSHGIIEEKAFGFFFCSEMEEERELYYHERQSSKDREVPCRIFIPEIEVDCQFKSHLNDPFPLLPPVLFWQLVCWDRGISLQSKNGSKRPQSPLTYWTASLSSTVWVEWLDGRDTLPSVTHVETLI